MRTASRCLSVGLLLLALALPLRAQPPALVGGPEAVLLKVAKEYTLNPDGSTELRVSEQRELLTPFAVNRLLGETFVTFDRGWQELTIQKSETVTPDGRRVPTPANGYIDITHRDAFHFPAYGDLHQMVISHTGLEVGAKVELEYTLRTKAGFQPFFSGREICGQPLPVRHLVLTVRVPAGTPLYTAGTAGAGQPKVGKAGAFQLYQWELKGLPAFAEERLAIPDDPALPIVYFSTLKDWAGFTGLLPKAELSAEAVESLLGEKVSGPGVAARLPEVLDLVQNAVQLVPIKLVDCHFAPAAPEEVLRRGYGTELEKALLTTALLRRAGFAAAWVGALPRFDPFWQKKVPAAPAGLEKVVVPAAVTGWWTRVGLDGKDLYIRSNGQVLHPSGCPELESCIWVRGIGIEGVPQESAERRLASMRLSCVLKDFDDTKGKVEGVLDLTGNLTDPAGLLRDAAGEAERAVRELFQPLEPEGLQVKLAAGCPGWLSVSFSMTCKKLFNRQAGLLVFQPPAPARLAPLRDLLQYRERTRGLRLPVAPLRVQLDFELQPKGGQKAVIVPVNVKMAADRAEFEQTWTETGDCLRLSRSFTLFEPDLAASAWPALRSVLVRWFDDGDSQVVFSEPERPVGK